MRPCAQPGCRELVERGCCEQHARRYDERRGSSTARGYDSDWERFRDWFLTRHALCLDCLADERPVPATEVHHVMKLRDRPDLRLVESNCRALCKTCHSRRTARGE